MFFRMPVSAIVLNWVGDWINGTFLSNFSKIDGGRRPAVTFGMLSDQQTEIIRRKAALIKAVRAVLKAYQALDIGQRFQVRLALSEQVDVPTMLVGAGASDTRSMLPLSIQSSLDDVSRLAFSALDSIGIRGESLDHHFAEGKGRLCAFCGIEPVASGFVSSPDWDHYLARTHYPFASYNLRNLTPMGVACNRTYKLSKDVLRSASGARRMCYDPYLTDPVSVDLRLSDPFGDGSRPRWVVRLGGNPDQSATWDDVFRVSDRWTDLLAAKNQSCIQDIASAFRRSDLPSEKAIEDQLAARCGPLPADRSHGDDLIRHAVFDHWLDYFRRGNAERYRICNLLKDAVRFRGRP
jgi:hypothetical protein